VIQIFTIHREQIAKFSYNFMESLGPVKELIQHPEQFNEKLFGFVDLTKTAFVDGRIDIFLVLLAIAAAYTQYIMGKQTMPHNETKKRLRDVMAEAAEGKQADQAEMNAIVMTKMMRVMPFFMFFIMISLPGALALYYATSNIVGAIQQAILLKKDEEELEELADQPVQTHKKATAKAREKSAQTPTVTRIVAKDTGKKASK
jgi:membrane protein insertase Oxa1/YidC/SpoIIIJ